MIKILVMQICKKTVQIEEGAGERPLSCHSRERLGKVEYCRMREHLSAGHQDDISSEHLRAKKT